MIPSAPSPSTGRADDPEQGRAGRDGQTGSQAAAPPPAAGERAGCAAPAPVDAGSPKAKPPQNLREFERALRGLGFTRLQAEHIARQGFSGATANTPTAPEPEPKADIRLTELRELLQRRVAEMKD